MSIDITKLKRARCYEDDKIKISFSVGSIDKMLSVYLYDSNKKRHKILWEISPRSHQNFDKTNDKIKTFVLNVVKGWERDEEEEARVEKEKELKDLMDLF